MQWVRAVVLAVRQLRSEHNIAPAQRIPLQLTAPAYPPHRDAAHREILSYIATMAKTQPIAFVDAIPPEAAVAMVGDMQIAIPLADLLDKSAVRARLQKELAELANLIARAEAKLDNAAFVQKAPPAVVQAERAKLTKHREQATARRAQLENLTRE